MNRINQLSAGKHKCFYLRAPDGVFHTNTALSGNPRIADQYVPPFGPLIVEGVKNRCMNCEWCPVSGNNDCHKFRFSTVWNVNDFTSHVMSLLWSLYLSSSLSFVRLCLIITLIECLKGYKFPRTLFEGVLLMFLYLHCLCHRIFLCHCLFCGQAMSTYYSDRMSERSQVLRIALWRCSLNVFVFVFVIVFVFVSLSDNEWLALCSKNKNGPVTQSVSDKVTYWAVRLPSNG